MDIFLYICYCLFYFIYNLKRERECIVSLSIYVHNYFMVEPTYSRPRNWTFLFLANLQKNIPFRLRNRLLYIVSVLSFIFKDVLHVDEGWGGLPGSLGSALFSWLSPGGSGHTVTGGKMIFSKTVTYEYAKHHL